MCRDFIRGNAPEEDGEEASAGGESWQGCSPSLLPVTEGREAGQNLSRWPRSVRKFWQGCWGVSSGQPSESPWFPRHAHPCHSQSLATVAHGGRGLHTDAGWAAGLQSSGRRPSSVTLHAAGGPGHCVSWPPKEVPFISAFDPNTPDLKTKTENQLKLGALTWGRHGLCDPPCYHGLCSERPAGQCLRKARRGLPMNLARSPLPACLGGCG